MSAAGVLVPLSVLVFALAPLSVLVFALALAPALRLSVPAAPMFALRMLPCWNPMVAMILQWFVGVAGCGPAGARSCWELFCRHQVLLGVVPLAPGTAGCRPAGVRSCWVLSRWCWALPPVRLKFLMVLDMSGGDVDTGTSGVWRLLKAAKCR